MRVAVIGAGLGGLGVALRLQGAGHEVVVLEGRERPGGRAYQLRDAGFTWDTGPSLITMPWVLRETFAAGGLDLDRELALRPLDPYYTIRWAGEERALDFLPAERMPDELARFSARDARAFDGFLAALRPIYEEGILGAGRRPFLRLRDLAAFTPRMLRLGAALPLWRMVCRHFEHPRVREAFSFHSLFIGGDPFRVPAIYGALVYLQFLDGVWYADGGVYAIVEAMARRLDVRCGERVARIEHRAGAVTGVVLDGGERIAADAVVSNADVLTTHELTGRRRPLRRMTPTMSCLLLYLGCARRFEQLRHHTLLVGRDYRDFVRDVTRDRRLPASFSTYLHAPARTEPAMAPPGADSIAVLAPVPNLRADIDWERRTGALRDALVEDLETTFGLAGLGASVRVEHRMTPLDFARELGAADGNAFAVEPTLHQSAALRQPNRDRALAGLYHVGGGTHPGAGIPGVLLGAEITAALVAADRPAPRRRPPMCDAELIRARRTTRRVARTFALCCRFLPRDVRHDVYRLYLVFRTLDDAVDHGDPDAEARLAAVEAWAGGAPSGGPEVRLLDALAERHPLPRSAFADFCVGMRHDLRATPIRDEQGLDEYCYRVAGTVGIVMAHVLGMRDPARALPAAAALGQAMQRTNILRDIDEDLAAGRVYIARSTLERFGGSLAPGRREALLRDQIARADALYEIGCEGIAQLLRGQRAIRMAATMYREILREIERDGYGERAGRAVVPRRRKLRAAMISR